MATMTSASEDLMQLHEDSVPLIGGGGGAGSGGGHASVAGGVGGNLSGGGGDKRVRNGMLHQIRDYEIVRIDSDVTSSSGSSSSSAGGDPYPREYLKTLLFFFWLLSGFIATTTTISFVHEKVPDREQNPPLPDIFFSYVNRNTMSFKVAEVLGLVLITLFWVLIFLHKHRTILMRRAFLLIGLLYMLRCVTMFVTVLPVPDKDLPCSQKIGQNNLHLILQRTVNLLRGAGMSLTNASDLCGDYIYSGHTFMLTLTYMFIKEYTPRRWVVFHWVVWSLAVSGVACVMLAHEHYTVDIIIAYWLATRSFWYLHLVAHDKRLQNGGKRNFASFEFWFPILKWSEKNVAGQVPTEYQWPIPWPKGLHGKTILRDSSSDINMTSTPLHSVTTNK